MSKEMTSIVIPITKQSQVCIFQLQIPRGTKKIIGVEAGMRMLSDGEIGNLPASFAESFTIKPSQIIADLRIQSAGKTNVFYAGEIYQNDLNLAFGDYSMMNGFARRSWTHEMRNGFEEVSVAEGISVLTGILRDRIGEQKGADIQYEVKVYVWYEI